MPRSFLTSLIFGGGGGGGGLIVVVVVTVGEVVETIDDVVVVVVDDDEDVDDTIPPTDGKRYSFKFVLKTTDADCIATHNRYSRRLSRLNLKIKLMKYRDRITRFLTLSSV